MCVIFDRNKLNEALSRQHGLTVRAIINVP